MRRRAHDLPDFPQLLHELPDNIDPMNPIYGDWAVDVVGRVGYQRYLGNFTDVGEVIIQDPRLRAQHPRPHHPRAPPLDYNQREIDLQRIAPQAIPAPRVDDPVAPNNIDPLDDFYEQWRAEGQQRQGNGQQASAQPRIPEVDPVPNGSAMAGENAGLMGRERAKMIFLGNRQAHLPPDLVPQPVARPNAVQGPKPPMAPPDVNARQRMRIRLRRPGRPENAEDLREQEEADALQRRIDQIKGARAARDARHAEHDADAHNASVELRARLGFEERRRQRAARAAFEADVMQGVAQNVPAPENDAQRIRDLEVAVRRQRDLREQNNLLGNNAMRDADRDMFAGSPSPSPSSSTSPSEDDAAAPPQPGDLLDEFMRDLDAPARPGRGIGMEGLLGELGRRRNDERRAEQELANAQQDLQRAKALVNAALPLQPNQYPRANPWVGVNDYHGPDQIRVRQHMEQVAIVNAPVHQNSNQNPGPNQNPNQQPGQVVNYNRPILRPINFLAAPEREVMPVYQPVLINMNNMPPIAGHELNQAAARLEAVTQAQTRQQLYIARIQAQAAARGQAMAQAADFFPFPPPPLGPHIHGYAQHYAQQYHVAREEVNQGAQIAQQAIARARAAVGGDAPGPIPFPGEARGDQMGGLGDAMRRNFREMRERMEGRIAEWVHVPEFVEEEYESEGGSGEEEV
ncbi:hypothetical protein ACEPPN_003851 [Leptodophora sp. 'Broadleaf-Isolate-01']